MKDMKITFSVETIREMIGRALHNLQLKIEVLFTLVKVFEENI
jgi:hypothetical protein